MQPMPRGKLGVRTLLLLSLLSPSAALAAAERLALLPATGANVDVGSLAAATDVLRSQVERTGRYVVLMATLPEGTGAREPTSGEAVAARRIMRPPEEVEQPAIGDLRGIELDQHRLGVACPL